jgi:hypothetical protein
VQRSGNVLKILDPIQGSIQGKRQRAVSKDFMIQRLPGKFLRFYLMPGMGEKFLHRFKFKKVNPAVTYNFDPDKWYDDELFLIQSKLKTGEIEQNEYDEAVEILDKKLEEMWKRLDGTYQVNNGN